MSKKTLIHIILLATLIAGMALTNISSASAQGIIPENTVSFAQLKVSDITLKGPLGADSIRFSLPADWQMTAGAELHLNFQVFTGDVQSNLPGTINPVAGFLTVRVNDVWVETVTIDHNGEYSVVISIPDTAWITTPPNARQSIRFSLESGQSCDMIQAALQRGIFTGLDTVIHPSSFLVLPHADTTLPLDLTLFPYPLYQRSFTPDTAVLVMPQHPTESELQAAITTAGALGSLTERGLLLTFVTADKLDPSTLNNVHVVFVGKPENLSLLQEAKWPLSLKDGKFSARELRADDGILQIAVSPYSRTKAWLLVSGNTDRGVIKASQAAGTGAIRTGSRPDLAIVSDVNIQSRNITQADLSLQDLGYQNMTLSGFGHQDVFAQFDIPLDFHVANEAYLDLVYSNSSLLDFEEAAITLELNDEFIGGLRLSDRTTNTTTYRFNIPGTSFHSGTNSMTIVASLNSATPCVPGNDIWVSIWSTSLLHVPLEPAAPNEKAASYDLGLYPKKLFPLFNNTTFVLAPNDPLSWTAAAQIAYDLGTYPRGSVINPSVTYPENLSPEARQNNDLLLIG
ncbi:MAG TPA: cellulose biosynthesis cyclic di-GMP-binding regulatory protein BcsB, partial [Anaerolineales bacterium]|nr:cellulose biosynthesis cyclic di-GMP-binding regulatory protein BcsB [Anaerolineales bacterium]